MARLEGRPVDRVPNNCIIMGFGARYIGATYKEFVTDYRALTEAGIRCREDFDLDILSAISDPMREAEGFGADVVIPEDAVPYASAPLVASLSDLTKLKVKDPASCARMNDRLLAVRRYAEYAQKDCAVQGWVEGGFAEACDLRDLNNMMMDIFDEPEAVAELLDICTRQAEAFAVAQVEAGADIVGIGDAAASLIGPAMYEEFALPYEKRIVEAIHKAGGKAKLHICGDIGKLLDLAVETGADLIDCDWMVDFEEANRVFGDRCSACGNFDPVGVLLQGTPDSIRLSVEKCLAVSSPRAVIAAGCEVPVLTPPENLAAVAEALKKAGA
jgi:MtaA/CmuA family methyltransferase